MILNYVHTETYLNKTMSWCSSIIYMCQLITYIHEVILKEFESIALKQHRQNDSHLIQVSKVIFLEIVRSLETITTVYWICTSKTIKIHCKFYIQNSHLVSRCSIINIEFQESGNNKSYTIAAYNIILPLTCEMHSFHILFLMYICTKKNY